MKLAKMYVKEFEFGGKNHCAKCGSPCHGNHCVFCINARLRDMGVSTETLRLASAVFRKNSSPEKVKQAIAAIEAEIK